MFAWDCVNDSDGTTHDGALSYLVLPKGGQISFRAFLQSAGLIPSLITINVAAQRGGAAHPRLQIGFLRGSSASFDAAMFDCPASWGLAARSFAIDPITGLPWDPGDLSTTEIAFQNEIGVNGNNQITLVSASIAYGETHNLIYTPEPVDQSLK